MAPESGTSPAAPNRPKQPMRFLDLNAQFAAIKPAVMEAVLQVMESQHFILGSAVTSFEEDIAKMTGCKFAIGCASGSDALLLALTALGVGPGDEVIAPSFTFVATAGSIARVHAKPVFIDIDPVTYNLDAQKLEKVITPRTKAIIPVHLFGLAADMDPILEIAQSHNIPVIEDAAQAIGSQYKGRYAGNIGAIGCFSFFPSKNLGGAGDGGMLTTNDPVLADALKILRLHGSRKKYQYERVGMNSRLDALQAAILRVKLKHLDSWAAGRQKNADRYRALFAEFGLTEKVVLPTAPEDSVHVYNQFTIRVQERDVLKKYLQEQGIPTEIYYPYPLHLQPAFAAFGYKPGDLPVTEAASLQVLSLPIYPEFTAEQQRIVVGAIADFYKHS